MFTDSIPNSSNKITVRAIKNVAYIMKCGFAPLRTCSICDKEIGYILHPKSAAIGYTTACDCSGSGIASTRDATWEELDDLTIDDVDYNKGI